MANTAILTGGGTAGHIYPALALAEKLQADGWHVLFAGTPGGVEARLAPEAGLPFQAFNASGFDRSRPYTLITGVTRIAVSTHRALKWLKQVQPQVVVGFGGYVSIPVVRAAEKLGVPVVVHEQNSVMGLANKAAARHATAVCLTYEGTREQVPGSAQVQVTGNPVRQAVLATSRAQARQALGIPEDATLLLVFGGSLGARHINQAMVPLKEALLARPNLYVMHIAGPKQLADTQDALRLTPDEQARYQLLGYQDRMPEALAAADVIVSRAGATSLAEISALGIPAVLVPFPYATADHQTTNAQAWVDSGAAFMVPDADVEGPHFREQVLALVDDDALRQNMRARAQEADSVHAAERLAKVVETL